MRTMKERVRDWVWWAEQVLHAALGGAIAYAFASDLPWWGSFTISATLGVARELFQNLRADGWDGNKVDAAIDVLFWAVGAALGSLVA